MTEEATLLQQRYEHSSDFLRSSRAASQGSTGTKKPYVTLTFAQTIDGYISGRKGRQLRLSGDESMAMTHCLRTLHDAILVGVGTLLNDDPRLNARLLPKIPPPASQPLPIILDSRLHSPPTCRLLHNYQTGQGRQPLFICLKGLADTDNARQLKAAGAAIEEVNSMDWPSILDLLVTLDVKSVMVEGGARVIESLLTAKSSPTAGAGDLIDELIITVSPNFAGSDSTGYKSPRWPDPVPKKTKQEAGQEEEMGAAFQVKKKDWFGEDAVWIWTRK